MLYCIFLLLTDSLPANTRERPPGCKTVFIGGLPETVTEETLQEMFANCGTICSLRLSKKNFAHIRFTSMESVDKALFFSGLVFINSIFCDVWNVQIQI